MMIDIDIQISISERSSGWAIKFSSTTTYKVILKFDSLSLLWLEAQKIKETGLQKGWMDRCPLRVMDVTT